jgi:hypothetical protein
MASPQKLNLHLSSRFVHIQLGYLNPEINKAKNEDAI